MKNHKTLNVRMGLSDEQFEMCRELDECEGTPMWDEIVGMLLGRCQIAANEKFEKLNKK